MTFIKLIRFLPRLKKAYFYSEKCRRNLQLCSIRERKKPKAATRENEDDKRQAFYVGGSNESGQQVLGPSKAASDDIGDNLFRAARQHGAEASDRSQQPTNSSATTAASSATDGSSGASTRLGDNSAASATAPTVTRDQGQQGRSATVQVVVQMWRNGFVVDDGPLRAYEIPESRQFLESIMQNRVPAELVAKRRGAVIELDLENHKNEEFKPAKVALKPFQGTGYTLGGK